MGQAKKRGSYAARVRAAKLRDEEAHLVWLTRQKARDDAEDAAEARQRAAMTPEERDIAYRRKSRGVLSPMQAVLTYGALLGGGYR